MYFNGKDYFFITQAGPKNKKVLARICRYFGAPENESTIKFLQDRLVKATLEYKNVCTVIKTENGGTIASPYNDENTKIIGFTNKNMDLITSENIAKLKAAIAAALEKYKDDPESITAYFSDHNSKVGAIPSFSVIPLLYCPGCTKEDDGCGHVCYALKSAVAHKEELRCYAENTILALKDPDRLWKDIDALLKVSRYFRFHVSGEILNKDYFDRLVKSVRNNPGCSVLMFSKKPDIVNSWIDENGPLPENLRLLLSSWSNFTPENPHNLPITAVIRENTIVPDNWKICGGNCEFCACRGCGCWTAKPGDVIAFYEH